MQLYFTDFHLQSRIQDRLLCMSLFAYVYLPCLLCIRLPACVYDYLSCVICIHQCILCLHTYYVCLCIPAMYTCLCLLCIGLCLLCIGICLLCTCLSAYVYMSTILTFDRDSCTMSCIIN